MPDEAVKLFISYRREDTKAASRLIYERLRSHFGERQVFFDIDNIPPGADFVQHLNDQVARCNVLLAVIGDRWTSGRKIHDDDDFVRIEICAALERGIPVVPIFADGAGMPTEDELPSSLKPFSRRQGLPLDSGRDFDGHISAVIRHTERLAREYEAAAATAKAATPAQHASDNRGPVQRYRVLERLEAAGDQHTEVFVAESRGMQGFQRRVLIRRVLPYLAENKRYVDGVLDEARIAGLLNHVNIQAVVDVGIGDNTVFCVYDYLDFETLAAILSPVQRGSQPFDPYLACYIAREVCRALDYAHSATHSGRSLGIVHRDVSPPNIYLVNDGRIVLTGFGFAKAATHIEKSEPGFVEGKVSYLSPEAALGQNVTWRSDLFSLGVVLWETVAGRRLFQADTDLDTVRLVQKAEIPHLNTVRPGYRGELDGVLHQLLARDPAKRFESTRAARRALEEVLRRGGTFSQDHIANLIAKYREAKPSASKGARSMISSLIDDALLEFTSLDERLPPRVEVPAAITQPEPVADAPFHFEAGNLAILEDDPIPLADHDGPLWSPPARPASVQSAPIGSASALHDGTHAATGQRPSLPLQAWTSLPARPLLSGLLVSFALTLTLAVAYLLTR